MNHTDILNIIAKKINAKSYLEIGVRYGANFNKIEVPNKIGIDPDPESAADIHMTSDQFFDQNTEMFDMVLVDGFHEAEQAKRDIINSWKFLNPGGAMLIHDCNPEKEDHTHIPRDCKIWNGNVYKAVSELQMGKFTINIDHGCCVLRKSVGGLLWGNVSIDWETFNDYRKHLLNLVTVEYGLKIIEDWT